MTSFEQVFILQYRVARDRQYVAARWQQLRRLRSRRSSMRTTTFVDRSKRRTSSSWSVTSIIRQLYSQTNIFHFQHHFLHRQIVLAFSPLFPLLHNLLHLYHFSTTFSICRPTRFPLTSPFVSFANSDNIPCHSRFDFSWSLFSSSLGFFPYICQLILILNIVI